ncbi:MAG TPA: DUF1206 domain-containing protein [Nakamurella sp.]
MTRTEPPTTESEAPGGGDPAVSAEQVGQRTIRSGPFRTLLSVGLVTYGVVHILIGWIAVRIAWTGRGEGQEASQRGALAEMAEQPFGAGLLWLTVAGLVTLSVWQVVEAIWGHRDRPAGFKRTRKRLGSVGRAVSYTAVAVVAVAVLRGEAGAGDTEEGWSARLMTVPAGRLLVIAIGVGIAALGVRLIRRGLKRKFTDDLAGGVGPVTVRTGQVGYLAKGIGFVLVGGLFGWAGVSHDPDRAGGLDDALRTVLDLPLGGVLLTAMALGLICFGVYCFFWARHPRVSTDTRAAGPG